VILLIDWGNTRLKWRLLQNGKRSGVQAVGWQKEVLEVLFAQQWSSLQPRRVLVCSVLSDEMDLRLSAWIELRWGVSVEWLRSSAESFGVRNAYRNPQQLGADRWSALLAARRLFQGNVCVISVGSALTLDCLATDGKHLGGQIFPGLRSLRRALQLDVGLNNSNGEAEWLAKSTQDGIVGGTLHGLASVIGGFVVQCEINLSAPVKVVMTGGDAELLSDVLDLEVLVLPDLILQGVEQLLD